jgi:hypothetical protein
MDKGKMGYKKDDKNPVKKGFHKMPDGKMMKNSSMRKGKK